MRGTAHLTEEKCPGHLHLTCEQRCQITRSCKAATASRIARQIGVDPSTISASVRNTGARGYRSSSAREGSQRREEARTSAQNDARFGGADEEKLTQEQWSPIRSAGVWRRMASPYQSRALYQHVGKTRKTGARCIFTCVTAEKIQQAQGQEFGRGLIPNRVDIDQRPPMSPQKAASETGRPTRYRRQSQRRCHVACRANLQIHQARQTAGQNANFVVQACARVLLPLADRIETIT